MLRRLRREALRTVALGGLLAHQTDAKSFEVPHTTQQPTEESAPMDAVVSVVPQHAENHSENAVEKGPTPGSLTVSIRVERNVRDRNGNVIGMTGQQALEYYGLDGAKHAETQTVNWTEDSKPDNSTLTYEHPAAPADFFLTPTPSDWHTKYRLVSDHPEGGITLHGLGKYAHSEGCILASDPFRRQIEHEAKKEHIHVEILPIVDARTPEEIAVAPLPYSEV